MLVNLENVYKQKSGRTLLSDINWLVHKGERWLVYGLNGAGKSTLLNIINAYDFATSGHVTLFDMSPGEKGYSAQAVRSHIGYVSSQLKARFAEGERVIDVVLSGIYQSIGLYQETTQDDIQRAEAMLETLDIIKYRDAYFGLLSTGEQQSVLLARAMMNSPDLLILDEPGNGLDFIARERLIDTLHRLYQHFHETAVIYVTHYVEEITDEFTHALLLKSGKIQQSGQIEEVMTSRHLSQLFNLPVKLYEHHHRYQIVRL
ncbi:ABC transporter ATP-binding protein [Staphylococcus canis]|uniref:ABC transporter ATP-binding protein n=1 Tax=Staphylococcus canis TaxID=2724942 RepID=A0ABS0TAX5_9STAP|nr:ABC transporter ATP-binding protein [Staphylococcus canis]MBI5975896.1 ABC transporter ATP-binding protein [Staphylococcus canis]